LTAGLVLLLFHLLEQYYLHCFYAVVNCSIIYMAIFEDPSDTPEVTF